VLFLPVCLGGGVLAYFNAEAEPPLSPACLAAGLALGLAWAARRRPLLLALVLSAGCFAAGFAASRLAASRAAPWVALPRHAVVLQGRVSTLELLPNGRRLTLAAPRLDGAAIARDLRIRLRATDTAPLAPGDVVRLRALVRPPAAPAYPGGWDMQREAYFTVMAGYGFALGPAERLSTAPTGVWQALRTTIAARTVAALPGTRGAIAATLLTGQASAIPTADRQAFAASGLAHLLAVAGLHIGIVMGVAFGLVRWGCCRSEYVLLHWPVRAIATISALAAGFLYLLLTGGHVPIWRSFAMASLATLAVLTGRRVISLRGLALAAACMVLVAPWELVGVSFQMSFAAVLALVVGWESARPTLVALGPGKWWRRPLLYVAGLTLTSALAGTASLPFAAYHFGSAALFYVPANMLAVPLTALWVMPWGMAALALMPLGLERVALVPMGWGIAGLDAIARGVAAWPDAVMRLPQMPGWGLLCLAGGMIWLGLWRSQLRLAGVLPLVFGLASPWLVTPPDAVVAPDAAIIALRAGGRIIVEQSARAGAFEAETPLRLWGDLHEGEDTRCQKPMCDAHLPGGVLRLLRQGTPDCVGAVVLVTAMPLHGACPGVVTVDRGTVARDGAVLIWLGAAGPVLQTDRDLRGGRPWFITAAAPSALPPAQTE
jgi:competence protein ComEC